MVSRWIDFFIAGAITAILTFLLLTMTGAYELMFLGIQITMRELLHG